MNFGKTVVKALSRQAIALLSLVMLAPLSAQAGIITLNFEGVAPYPNGSNVLVNDFYNGGTSSAGLAGPNLGVSFSSDVLLLCLNTAGVNCSNTSKGGVGVTGSDKGAIYFLSGNPIMNVWSGFTTGFSGVFSAPFTSGTTIKVWSGLNATGNILAELTLGTSQNGSCDVAISGGAAYCPFIDFALPFNGIGLSVQFGGTLNQQVFDDLTFGSITPGGKPVPAPTPLVLIGLALVGIGLSRLKKSA
jgi:hypothetical protein